MNQICNGRQLTYVWYVLPFKIILAAATKQKEPLLVSMGTVNQLQQNLRNYGRLLSLYKHVRKITTTISVTCWIHK